METEFIKAGQFNYARYRLDDVQEKRYQYRMITRGGISGLLDCSMRNINGINFLYYDITSKQSIRDMFRKKKIDRKWMMRFIESIKKAASETYRFLLDFGNIIWEPELVFQDLDGSAPEYIYLPYCDQDAGFGKMMDFLIERLDYADEKLVETVYKMYDAFEQCGYTYLKDQIFKDAEVLEGEDHITAKIEESGTVDNGFESESADAEKILDFKRSGNELTARIGKKKGFFSILDGSRSYRKKDRDRREKYYTANLFEAEGIAVAEDEESSDEEERTVFIDLSDNEDKRHRLFSESGKVIAVLEEDNYIIGKKEGDSDIVINDPSVSRMHARVFVEDGEYYIEDLNSTNGSSKNGMKMQPYEKKRLHPDDEILLGDCRLCFK